MTRPVLQDRLARPLGSLRLSVTDRCNLRCRYCMPEDEYVWLPRSSILTFEELGRLAGIFASLGASKVRLTGGEPLLRHDLPALVHLLGRQDPITDLAMTTNGLLLARHAVALREAGLSRITVSLDTLVPERMERFARSSRHADVLAGIDAARAAGLAVKLNTVVIAGYNEDELLPILEFARARGLEPRFIEYMDVGGATQWSLDQVVRRDDMLDRIAARLGPVTPEPRGVDRAAPAERFRLADGFRFGVIASTTAPFCRDCDRSRLTADGTWYLCLYARDGIDLRAPVREGATDEELRGLIRTHWQARTDRGAEARLAVSGREALVPLEGLRADPRLEMHTRGG